MSGSAGCRSGAVVAMLRISPPRCRCMMLPAEPTWSGRRPPMTSVAAGASPRQGACTKRAPVPARSRSISRCEEAPLPEVPWARSCVRAAAISVAKSRIGEEGCTEMTSGVSRNGLIGAKSSVRQGGLRCMTTFSVTVGQPA